MGLMNRVLTSQGQSSLLQKAKELRLRAEDTARLSRELPDEKKKP